MAKGDVRLRAKEFITEFDASGYKQRYTLYTGDAHKMHKVDTFADLEDAIEEVRFLQDTDPRTVTTFFQIKDINDEVVWNYDPDEVYDAMRRGSRIQFQKPTDLGEAGEPTNPGRRGFLRALGAAGVAAAMPGTAVKALATPTAAAEVPTAAAAAAGINPATIAALWKAATAVGNQQGYEFDPTMYTYQDPEMAHMDEYDGEWIPGENDLHTEPQGQSGAMPWGSDYEVFTTPGGIPVIRSGITDTLYQYTFIRDGKTYWFQYYADRGGDGVEGTNIPGLQNFDFDEYNKDTEATEANEWDINFSLIDDIVSGQYKNFISNNDTDSDNGQLPPKSWDELSPEEQKQREKEWDDWEEQLRSKILSKKDPTPFDIARLAALEKKGKKDTTPFDIARLAGLAKQGYNKLTGKTEPAAPAAQPPQALPAPTKPDFDLTPDLKQKQAEPAKRKDKDENK